MYHATLVNLEPFQMILKLLVLYRCNDEAVMVWGIHWLCTNDWSAYFNYYPKNKKETEKNDSSTSSYLINTVPKYCKYWDTKIWIPLSTWTHILFYSNFTWNLYIPILQVPSIVDQGVCAGISTVSLPLGSRFFAYCMLGILTALSQP